MLTGPLVDCDLRDLHYLQREVLCQRRLQHDHVIGFREVGITTSLCLYLCLEYANGGNLRGLLAGQPGGRLPEDTARWFTQQLVYGLAYCHLQGVFNRDIKPANLLLHSDSESPLMLKLPPGRHGVRTADTRGFNSPLDLQCVLA
ncbi:putative CBL-interacting protein kinase 13 [Tetrabaena socialis]|uniref:Putative CBL-interacting protein kinase 13 n=1 Tax=Tetrabaena socialis TaxID=47790 RepID=A0A2J8ACD1_9CHLO|nr:putative CBL-interacting protein kinase 13 [Tetrabaena socialis]|eukprot:PNH10181.1 putative CBL-interacting protein kinase 13 [Tetrabaena socialis]